jgi:hypothetical protein
MMKTAVIYDNRNDNAVLLAVLNGDFRKFDDVFFGSTQCIGDELGELMESVTFCDKDEFAQAIRDGAELILCYAI